MRGLQCGDVMRYLCTNSQPAWRLQLVLQAWLHAAHLCWDASPPEGNPSGVRGGAGRLLISELVNGVNMHFVIMYT